MDSTEYSVRYDELEMEMDGHSARVYNPNAVHDVATRARTIYTWQREPTDISGH